jgi:hypothetical protein
LIEHVLWPAEGIGVLLKHGRGRRALSRVRRTPTALAIAIRCSTALVEPPSATTIT